LNKKHEEIYKELMQSYKFQWDANQYNRTNYDEEIEVYTSYRNPADYPMPYNESFNRVLPIIHTILSRFMDQLYQSGNIISVKPRNRKDIERAKSVEGVLNFQMENLNNVDCQGGSYLTMMKWFFNTITFGKGIVKAYWKKEERISPRRMMLPRPKMDRFGRVVGMDYVDHISQEMQTVYDGPYVEVIHNKLFVPDPEYRDIQKMPRVFLVYKRSLDYIKRMADKGVYKNIKELGVAGSGGASGLSTDSREAFIKSLEIEGANETESTNESQRQSPDMDIIEAYGKVILEDSSYTVGSGYKIKGPEEEVIAHIGNYRTLLSLQKNQYGIRPLFDMGCYMHPEMYWDLGMVRLTKGIQRQIDNLGNLRIQNAMMMINPMLKVQMEADIDPESLVWKPFGVVGVDDMDDVQPLIIPDTNSNLFMEQESFYKNTIQDLMGMYDYNMGQTPQRQERVGVVYGIQQMGEARAKLLLMSMDHLGIRPLLRYLMILNTFHLPSGFEFRIGAGGGDQQQFSQIFGDSIHPNFDFAARYTAMEPALGKGKRGEQLIQLAGLWKDNPWINQYQWNKTILELNDVREADYLLKQPEQFAQEQQQQVQQQMKAAQLQEQLETQGDIQKSQVDSQGRIAKSQLDNRNKLAVTKLKGEYDLLEAAIGHDAQIEAAKAKPKGNSA